MFPIMSLCSNLCFLRVPVHLQEPRRSGYRGIGKAGRPCPLHISPTAPSAHGEQQGVCPHTHTHTITQSSHTEHGTLIHTHSNTTITHSTWCPETLTADTGLKRTGSPFIGYFSLRPSLRTNPFVTWREKTHCILGMHNTCVHVCMCACQPCPLGASRGECVC